MSQVCRTCLKIIENKSEVFNIELKEPTHDIAHIKAKLEACVPEIVLNRVKNSVICNFCLGALNTAYEFKTKCLESEKKIYHFIKYSTNEGIDLNKFIAKHEPNDQNNSNMELSARPQFGQTESNLQFNPSSKNFHASSSALYPTSYHATSQNSPAPAPTSPFYHQTQMYQNKNNYRVSQQAVFQSSMHQQAQPFSSHYSSQNLPTQQSNGSSPSILQNTLINRPPSIRHQSLDAYNPTSTFAMHPRFAKNQSNYHVFPRNQSFNSDSNSYTYFPYPSPQRHPQTHSSKSNSPAMRQRSPFSGANPPPLGELQNLVQNNQLSLNVLNVPTLPVLNPPPLAEFQPPQDPKPTTPSSGFNSPPPDVKPIVHPHSPKVTSPAIQPPLLQSPLAETALIQQASIQEPLALHASIQEPLALQTSIQEPSVLQGSIEEPSAKQASIQEPLAQQASTQEPLAQQASVQEPLAQQGSIQEPSAQKGSIQEPLVQQTSIQKSLAQQASIQEPLLHQASIQKPLVAQASTQELLIQQASAEESFVQQTSIQDPVLQQAPVREPSSQQISLQDLLTQKNSLNSTPVQNKLSSLESLLLQPTLDNYSNQLSSIRSSPGQPPFVNQQSLVFQSSSQSPQMVNHQNTMQPPPLAQIQLSSMHSNRGNYSSSSPYNRPSNFNPSSPLSRFNIPSSNQSSARFTPPPFGKFNTTPPHHQSSFNFPSNQSELNSNSSMYPPSYYSSMHYNNAAGSRPPISSGDTCPPMFHPNFYQNYSSSNRQQHFSGVRSPIRPHLSSIRPHLSSIRSNGPSPPPQNMPPLYFPPSSSVSSFLQGMRPSQASSFLQHSPMYRLSHSSSGSNPQVRLFNPNFSSLQMNGQDSSNQAMFPRNFQMNNKFQIMLCPICGRNFATKDLLDQHMTIHTFKCEPCNFLTTSNESYIEHMATHKICDTAEDAIEKVQEPIEQVYKCNSCNYNTQDKAAYEEHIISHKSEYFFKCQLCTFKTIHSYSLRRHMKVHCSVVDTIFKCNECALECDKDSILKDHMIKSHSEKVSNTEAEEDLVQVEPYQVSIDDIQNIFQDNHESNDEEEKDDLLMENEAEILDDSDSYMITAADLEQILKDDPSDDGGDNDGVDAKSKSSDFEMSGEDGGGEKTLFKCSVCNQPFQFKYQLKKHMIIHSVTKKILECKMCEYRTTTKSHLQVHIATHTGGKIYRCDQCSYCTVYASNLEKHTRVHTGEKPYKCDYCDYSVTKLSRLKNHLINHAKQKLYTCKECFYEADSEENLLNHKEIHTMGKHFLEDPIDATTSNLS